MSDPKQQSISTLKGAPKSMHKHPDSDMFYQDLMKASELAQTGTASDKLAAAQAASIYAVFKAAERDLYDEETGEFQVTILQEGDKGQDRMVQNPAFQVYQTTQKQIQGYLSEFGLTPKARKQVEKLQAEKESALLTFLQNGE
ncbi:phage terminase, small subunit [Moritella viscosa]|nr:P27 family phage terminase small subunit [Moritella viscosa]CED59841.1 phage terminase, small subunit [Moritella viscosa]SHO03530.1 Phage terminase, small subunit, P27 family [Moritella viscosa]